LKDAADGDLKGILDYSEDELDLLKETVDTLIVHVERLKEKQSRR
jgi:voltage-gated potassium channel